MFESVTLLSVLLDCRPDQMEAFNAQCKQYGKCPQVETATAAKVFHQFLKVTYGNDVTVQLLPELVRLLPDPEKNEQTNFTGSFVVVVVKTNAI